MINLRFKKGYTVLKQITDIIDSLKDDTDYVLKIKQYRKKRSNNANKYMWALCGKLSDVLNISSVEIYQTAIKEIGLYRDVELSEEIAKFQRSGWELIGLGWFSEQIDYAENGNDVIIRFYYGSSVYNSKQMARLIDYIVNECKQQDIETATPEELARLCEDWHPEVVR